MNARVRPVCAGVLLLLLAAPAHAQWRYYWAVSRDGKPLADALQQAGALTIEDYGRGVLVMSAKPLAPTAAFDVIDLPPLDRIGHWAGDFDPLDAARDKAKVDEQGRVLALIQFKGIVRDTWLAELRKSGVETVSFFPHAAYIVRYDERGTGDLEKLPFVRAIVPWSAALKLGPGLPGNEGKKQEVPLTLVALGDAPAPLHGVEKRFKIESSGRAGRYTIIHGRADGKDIEHLADQPAIVAIELNQPIQFEDESASLITCGLYADFHRGLSPPVPTHEEWLTTLGIRGHRATVAIADDGPVGSHPHFTGRTTDILGGTSADPTFIGHALSVAGIIAGDCAHPRDVDGYRPGHGVAPGASLLLIPRRGRPAADPGCAGLTETVCQARQAVTTRGTNGVTGGIQNNSWGNGAANPMTYGAEEQLFDLLVRDADQTTTDRAEPLITVFSAGNEGSSGLTRPKGAKNIIAVGGTVNYRPLTSGGGCSADIAALYGSSSIGNVQDGRVKPDVVAPGAGVVSSYTHGRFMSDLGRIDDFHSVHSGTSLAAPNVAGQAALFYDLWSLRYRRAPSPANIRALLVNTADDIRTDDAVCSGGRYVRRSEPYPNMKMGWGRVNTRKHLEDTDVPKMYRDQEPHDLIRDSLQTVTYNYVAGVTTEPVYVTVAWTDKEGAIGANPALVNDLDLEVDLGGRTWRGNVLNGRVSLPGGTPDRLNNIESVFRNLALAGEPLTIRVRGTAINGDGVPYNGDDTDQDFALVVYNACAEARHRLLPPKVIRYEVVDLDGKWAVDLKWEPPKSAGAKASEQDSDPSHYSIWRTDDPKSSPTLLATVSNPAYRDIVEKAGPVIYFIRSHANCSMSPDSELLFVSVK